MNFIPSFIAGRWRTCFCFFRRMRKVMTKHLIKVIIRMDEHILQIVALYSSLQMKRLNKSLDIPLQRTFEYMLLFTLPLNL